MRVLNIGNAAHIGGLVWGMILAFSESYTRLLRWSIGSLFIALLVSVIFFNPLSVNWLSYRAYVLHENQKLDEAMKVYREILERDSKNEFARFNLAQLEIAKMSNKALKFHEQGSYEQAVRLYKEILRREPGNEFAKANLNNIEVFDMDKRATEFRNQKEFEKARQLYREILKRDPGNVEAAANLTSLPPAVAK